MLPVTDRQKLGHHVAATLSTRLHPARKITTKDRNGRLYTLSFTTRPSLLAAATDDRPFAGRRHITRIYVVYIVHTSVRLYNLNPSTRQRRPPLAKLGVFGHRERRAAAVVFGKAITSIRCRCRSTVRSDGPDQTPCPHAAARTVSTHPTESRTSRCSCLFIDTENTKYGLPQTPL